MSKLDPKLTRALTVGGVLSREHRVHASAGAVQRLAAAQLEMNPCGLWWAGETGLSSCLLLRDLIGCALISVGAPLASQPLPV